MQPRQFVMHIFMHFKNWGSSTMPVSIIIIQPRFGGVSYLREARNPKISDQLLFCVQRYILHCNDFLHIPVLESRSSAHPLQVFSFGNNIWKSQWPTRNHLGPSGYKCRPLPQVEKHKSNLI